jgi:hypothetical protein
LPQYEIGNGPKERKYKLKKAVKYDKVLQDLERQYVVLMTKYLSKLHHAYHKDKGLDASHVELVNKIKQDCVLMSSNTLARLTFDDRPEEEVVKEILEYNFDMEDIKHMKEEEHIDLYPFRDWLEENCVKRTEPEWFQFGIHELIANGKANPGTIGSKRTQFCRFCGEEIYAPMDHNAHAPKHKKITKE